MKYCITIILWCVSLLSLAQDNRDITVKFTPTFSGKPIAFESAWYKLKQGDSVQLETFRYYISGVVFYNNGSHVFTEKDSYHLMDATADSGMRFTIHPTKPIKFDEIKFNLGIDSVTNLSGAMGGDLDPTKGMYWSWQSGYINLKLEGKSNLCPTRKNEFQFHLGGYSKETKAVTEVRLKTTGKSTIVINIPLDNFLNGVGLSTNNSIMIPCPEAVALSHKIAQLFEVTTE
jgi:hypothetical protein